MPAGNEPMSHQHMVERVEWPLLDCIQEYHFFYRPNRDDIADYRHGFARELAQKRGKMYQLRSHAMEFRPISFDQELLFHAPRYKQLFQVLSEAEWRFSTQSTFAGALTRSSRSLDEEIFALIAIGRDGNDRQALSALRKANILFAAGGAPKIEYLFLVAAGFELSRGEDGHAFEQEMNRLEIEYADHHHITELFQFNQTVWGPPRQRADGEFEPDVRRVSKPAKRSSFVRPRNNGAPLIASWLTRAPGWAVKGRRKRALSRRWGAEQISRGRPWGAFFLAN